MADAEYRTCKLRLHFWRKGWLQAGSYRAPSERCVSLHPASSDKADESKMEGDNVTPHAGSHKLVTTGEIDQGAVRRTSDNDGD